MSVSWFIQRPPPNTGAIQTTAGAADQEESPYGVSLEASSRDGSWAADGEEGLVVAPQRRGPLGFSTAPAPC